MKKPHPTGGSPHNLAGAKVLLVYPPASYVDMPTLGIPCLTGYLKAQGVGEVDVWDSNLGFLGFLLEPATLLKQEEKIRSKEAVGGTETLQAKALYMLPQLRSAIQDAIDIFHDPKRYYDTRMYDRAMAIVRLALECYSTEPDPIRHTFGGNGFSVEIDRTRMRFSMDDLIQFAGQENSYRLLHEFFQSHLSFLTRNSPFDLVGFSCANPQQLLPALLLARWMREAAVSKAFVIGGSFITTLRDVICSNAKTFDIFDYVVTFEGEKALLSLLNAVVTGGELKTVPNLHYRQGESIRHNSSQKIEDLNQLPTPDFSGLRLQSYWTPEPVLPMYCTRGCYYDICSFCNHHENYFGQFRARTTDSVIHDIKTYEKLYRATKLFFVDELLIPKQHVEIAERIAREKLSTRWYAHSRVENYFTKERLELLAQGGVTLLHVGMESANSRVLKLMKKGYDRERVLRFLGDLRGTPITAHLNTIRSFPGEQPEEYLETLETVWEYAKAGDYIHLYDFNFDPGAPIAEGGNPYVASVQKVADHDLDNALEFSLVNIQEPTPEQQAETERLMARLGQNLPVLAGLFPSECCWAAHLLYVSRYRDKGEGKKLEQPLSEMEIVLPGGEAFSAGENLKEWEISLSEDSRILSFPGTAASQWVLFNAVDFAWIPISERLGTILRRAGPNPLLISAVEKAGGIEVRDLRTDLYKWFRAGIVRLTRPRGKRTAEVQAA
ncbi:MAG TPA: B12-binding domain-containing radical SAM protein [Bdellovibrionota bacterium]|nr:B12-binding domain-containing radical SAM protein [Bdellovibrionota bacterium]